MFRGGRPTDIIWEHVPRSQIAVDRRSYCIRQQSIKPGCGIIT